jgi:hypothetical protein
MSNATQAHSFSFVPILRPRKEVSQTDPLPYLIPAAPLPPPAQYCTFPSTSVFVVTVVSCPSASLIKHYDMKAHGEVDVQIHVFLTSALVGGEWSASRPCRGKSPWYPLGRRLGGPQSRPGRYGEKKSLVPTGTRTQIHRSCRPMSLYRLSCPCSDDHVIATVKPDEAGEENKRQKGGIPERRHLAQSCPPPLPQPQWP